MKFKHGDRVKIKREIDGFYRNTSYMVVGVSKKGTLRLFGLLGRRKEDAYNLYSMVLGSRYGYEESELIKVE